MQWNFDICETLTRTAQAENVGPVNSVLKRSLDIVLASSALVFLMPLLLAAALAVMISSPGPVLYRQRRSGLHGHVITILKFRTMYTDLCDHEFSSQCHQATENDPRITPVGWFLRRTSIDELPQLINILKGEMSIVGPRPHAIPHDEYYSAHIKGYVKRYTVRPGLTGLAQVMGHRGETKYLEDMQKRIDADIYYIDSWSMKMDIYIILRTLFTLPTTFV